MSVLASAESISVVDAIKTAATSVSSDVMTGLGAILPIALGIMGASLVIAIVVKVFKTVAKK